MARPEGGSAGTATAGNSVRFGATDAAMLLTTLIWAVNFSVVKYGIRIFPPHGFNGVRMTLASLIYLVVWALLRDGFSLRKGDLWKAAGLGLLGTTGYQFFFIQGLRATTASTTSMIAPMTPVFIAMLSHFLGYERVHLAAWVGIAVSFTGFYLLLTGQAGPLTLNSATVRANLLILAANLMWALYTVFSRPLLARIPPLRLAILTTSFGTLFYLPLAAGGIADIRLGRIPAPAWGAVFFSGVLAIVVGYAVYYSSVRKVGNTKTAIYSNLNPVFATIFAVLFLAERVTPLQVGGGLVIFLGVYLTRSGYRYFKRARDERFEV
ncbi:MAG TPA: DMT family transporter [Acidobacteriota bacterium]|nr:DMT family transporter [Acidobacteriota bacterium]